MDNFNFYINVDQCLNMSNFDLFFYRLQKEQRFHLSNVHFYDDKSKLSLQNAMHGIRSFMDKNPFLVGDYRLIFGMRKQRVRKEEWKDTILYRLLKIYYSMQDSRIFIRSKEAADKNVTVIMLYDTDLVFDMPELKEYDMMEDLEALMNYLEVNWTNSLTDVEIYQKMNDFLTSTDGEKNRDIITRRFLTDFFKKYSNIQKEAEGKTAESKNVYIHNLVNPLVTYTEYCVGHYSVFRKEIDKNSLDQNLLALLTLVDYITADQKGLQSHPENYQQMKLSDVSKKQWKVSNDDSGIHHRYAAMLHHYKKRLDLALREMSYKIRDLGEGEEFLPFREPEELEAEKGLTNKEEEFYQGDFKEILKAFLKNSMRNEHALMEWEKAYTGLKEKINKMEEELALFAKDLSNKYKKQLEERKRDGMRMERIDAYAQKDVLDKIDTFEKRKKEILIKLKSPKMNPSLKFQDQLNLENTLEKCNLEVTFFVKCQEMIKFVNFILLVAFGGGLVTLCHFIMQPHVLANGEKLMYFAIFTAASFFLYLQSWSAPYDFFRKKIKESMRELEMMMDIYIRGYFEKAENFKEYINAINELDAIGAYLDRLEACREDYETTSRKYLWHKVQIQEHLRKNSYFEDLIQSVNPSEFGEEIYDCKLDVESDVIHNKLYWPQSS